MFCAKCGTQIAPGAKFCAGCGAPVAQPGGVAPGNDNVGRPAGQPAAGQGAPANQQFAVQPGHPAAPAPTAANYAAANYVAGAKSADGKKPRRRWPIFAAASVAAVAVAAVLAVFVVVPALTPGTVATDATGAVSGASANTSTVYVPTKVTACDSDGEPSGATYYTYDDQGRKISYRRENTDGKVLSESNYSYGEDSIIPDGSGKKIISCDEAGRPIEFGTNDNSYTLELEYDEQGWIVAEKQTLSSGNVVTWNYQDGLKVSEQWVDKNGAVSDDRSWTYERDSQGHIVSVTSNVNYPKVANPQVTYSVECDSNGNPVKVSDSNGIVLYTYEWTEISVPNTTKGWVKHTAMDENLVWSKVVA